MAVVKSTPRTEQAAVTFLKWFTAREQYEVFSGASGYLPVKISSPDETVWKSVKADESHVVKDVLQVGQAMTQTYTLCSGKTFQGCGEARVILETSLQEKAASDRRLVMNRISEGYTREEAVALLNTTGNFYQWYASLIRQLELAAGIRAEESHPRFMVR